MTDKLLTELETLLAQANGDLHGSQQPLQELLLDEEVALLSNESLENRGRILELVLQYRLDRQNALTRVLGFEPIFLQLLGLSPHYSAKINLERMAFALGNDDLTQLLYLLSELLHSLLRVASRYQHQSKNYREAHAPRKTSYKKFYLGLQKACGQQKLMLSHLESFEQILKKLVKREAIGPVLDHLAALRGPISQFHQALLNGFDYSARLYKKINPHLQLQENLGSVLKKTELLLQQLPAPAQPLFSPVQATSAQRLEQRASAKRLGNFFNH